MRAKILAILLLTSLVIADQLLKWVAFTNPLPRDLLLFRFGRALNPGCAFGLFKNHRGALTALSIAASVGFSYLFLKTSAVEWMLISAGCIGNTIDRLTIGAVRDFITFRFVNFPLFNLADALINIGFALFVLKAILRR